MAAEKTQAIVLKAVEFRETKRALTMVAGDFGKIGALAKGARRPKSPFEGALDLLALVRIVFLRKSSEGLDLLTEAKLQRRFRSAQRNLSRLYAGYYVAELLSELTDKGDPHRELFQAADRTLLALDEEAPVAETVVQFELAALRLLGHMPSLGSCVVCGKPVAANGGVAFAMTAGGVLCGDCRPGRRGVVSVSGAAIDALQHAVSGGNEVSELPTIAETIRGELRAVMGNYFAHLVGHRLRMSEYLGKS